MNLFPRRSFWLSWLIDVIDLRIEYNHNPNNVAFVKSLSVLLCQLQGHKMVDPSALRSSHVSSTLAAAMCKCISNIQISQQVKAMVIEFVTTVFAASSAGLSTETHSIFVLTCQSFDIHLPTEVKDLVSTVLTMRKLIDAAARVKAGKSAGALIELTTLQGDVVKASTPNVILAMDEFDEFSKTVLYEWTAAFAQHKELCKDFKHIHDFVDKYDVLFECIDAWVIRSLPLAARRSDPGGGGRGQED